MGTSGEGKSTETFEKALGELEKSVEKLQNRSSTLESALANYEKGISAYRKCESLLSSAEQKVRILRSDAGFGKAEEENFEDMEIGDSSS